MNKITAEYKADIKNNISNWKAESKRNILVQLFGMETDTWGRVKISKNIIQTYLPEDTIKKLTEFVKIEVTKALSNVKLTVAYKQQIETLCKKSVHNEITDIIEAKMEVLTTADPEISEQINDIKKLHTEIYKGLLDVERLKAEKDLEEIITQRKRLLRVTDIVALP